jgi:hypothetical protein
MRFSYLPAFYSPISVTVSVFLLLLSFLAKNAENTLLYTHCKEARQLEHQLLHFSTANLPSVKLLFLTSAHETIAQPPEARNSASKKPCNRPIARFINGRSFNAVQNQMIPPIGDYPIPRPLPGPRSMRKQ